MIKLARVGRASGKASGLAPRSMIIVFAPFTVIMFGNAKALGFAQGQRWGGKAAQR
jgi:hypothetical protein